MLLPLLLSVSLAAADAPPPKPFTRGASIEGVTEYGLPNGLRVLLVPDDSVATVTVNLTVLVGSRHEGYGEKGMAHLLEHMLFKGSTRFKDPKREMGERGARWNGTTREDRTNYFETLPASDANTEFAIRFEADRLVNSFVAKKDLDTEMTVVRNEFEMSENNPQGVLYERVRAIALPWHNYGRAVIGTRADIERVPIENLQAFYKKYYQPDNTVLVVAGKFDQPKVFTWLAESFGAIAKPARALPATFTEEPVQDGERSVTIRRVGGTPVVSAAWRIAASTDPDFPALMALQGVLGDTPQGRVHQALVEGKKAAAARCDIDELKEPGLFQCMAEFKPGDPVAAARDLLVSTVETAKPLDKAEVERAREGWLSQWEQMMTNSEFIGRWLSEWAAQGDWRMLYVQRDRLKAVTAEDVQRVWAKYFKPQNRSVGEYVPTEKPDRAQIPNAPEVGPLVAGFKGGAAVQEGEVFDPSPKNIEARTRRSTLPNGAALALLPKKTRAQTVKLAMLLRYGTADSLKGQQVVADLTAALLNRGTKKLGYKDFRNALERLRAQLGVSPMTADQAVSISVSCQRPQLAEVLALLGEVLKDPGLDAKELDILKSEQLAQYENEKDEPTAVGPLELARRLAPLPKAHPGYVMTFPERIAATKAATVAQVKGFYARFYGAQAASIAVVGDFDEAEVTATLTGLFGGWSSKEPFALAKDPYVAASPANISIPTPDKQNAWLGAGANVALTENSPDYPAASLAAFLLGGSPSMRLFGSMREQKGLSYGAYAYLDADAERDRASVASGIIYAPQNLAKVESTLQTELDRWTAVEKDELERARSELLNLRLQARADDQRLVDKLARQGELGRTMAWEEDLEAKLRAVTPAAISAVVKKHVDPKKMVVVKAGDFKTVSAPK